MMMVLFIGALVVYYVILPLFDEEVVDTRQQRRGAGLASW
jgi:hypothetical protein